ncbi:MAG: MAPEG family protein [Acaryochloridaceae cyanobacterium RU_4_10]|jgi:uncharacterized MAPEG superfamily protein|nr:MAPEG family protein [Acaryochloridaceae cyanobacterium RU_4_10]
MTTDLICLLILALWTIPLNHIPAIARVTKAGVAWGLSNRDTMPEVPDWVCRADRAQRNHHDNLAAIATVILIAHVTQQTNNITAIASITVVGLRILHSLSYIAGIPTVRSFAYAGSIVGLLAIVWQIFA